MIGRIAGSAWPRPVSSAGLGRAGVAWWLGGALAAALCAALLVTLAYQRQPAPRLTIGDETSDKGVVRDFYADERREGDGLRFRWTRGDSTIALPAWGPGPYRLAIEMGAPLNPEPVVAVLVNGRPVGEPRLGLDVDRYEFAVPAEVVARGDVSIALRGPTFSPPNDRRRLGVVVHAVELTPLGGRPVIPPATGLAAGVGLALLAYATLALAGWRWRGALGGAVGVALALAGLLAGARLFIVPVIEELIGIGALALGATLALRLALAGLARWSGWRLPATERAWLLTLVAAALLARLAGSLHPQIDIIDLGFHVNRFTDVAERGMLFLRIRSAEWGGRETVYSPAAYLAMLPAGWLIPDKRRMIPIFTALMETSRLLLVFALARRVSGSGRTALLAAALFVSLPLAVLPFSWGITSNLFGEWWATALLLVLTLGWARLARPAVALLAVAVAALALLAHPGDLLLTGGFLGLLVTGLIAAWAWGRWRARGSAPIGEGGEATASGRRVASVALIAALAAGLAFALFYRVDAAMMLGQGGSALSQRLTGEGAAGDQPRRWRVSGSVDDKSLGLGAAYVTDWRQVPLEGAKGYLREAWAYYWGWPLLAAGVGWWLLRRRARGRPFTWLALAWVGTAVAFALVGLLLNLYVRYMLFLLPVVCVLAGVALEALARRGRPGSAAVAAMMAVTVIAGLAFWYQRIVFFFH